MKIFFFSQRFVFPMDTGAKIRTGNMLKELGKKSELTIVSNIEMEKDGIYLEEMKNICKEFIGVPWIEPKRYTLFFYMKLLFQSLSKYPISVLNDYSIEMEKKLTEELEKNKYDLVICDFLQSTLNFRRVTGIPMLLFQHNVEAQITERHLRQAKNILSKLFWRLQHKRMLRHEGKMCRKFDGTIAVSDQDKSIMTDLYQAENVFSIPTGVNTDFFYHAKKNRTSKQLVFTGSMDWLPNEDAMSWFLNDVFPKIKKVEPDTNLVIVGRRPSPNTIKLVSQHQGAELTGWVEDTRPYIENSAVFIVPIRIGGGTRLKIYESLSMGKALVSTTVGAEGLPLIDGEYFVSADTSTDFATAVIDLLQDSDKSTAIGNSARQYVYENYRWERVVEKFLDICEEVSSTKNDVHTL